MGRYEFLEEVALADCAVDVEGNDLDDLFATAAAALADVMVDPATKTVEDDPQRNTEVRVWLEFGPWHKPESLSDAEREAMPDGCAGHDIDLDCGATTFEQAVMILAQKVFERYGDY